MAGAAIRAGRLRDRLTIQARATTPTRSLDGGFVNEYAAVDTVWGRIVKMTGRELEIANQIDNRSTHKIRIRFFTPLDEKCRFRVDGDVFNIIDIDDWERRGIYQDIIAFIDPNKILPLLNEAGDPVFDDLGNPLFVA